MDSAALQGLALGLVRSKEFILSITVFITIGLVLGGQNNLSFSVYWAAPEVGLSGKTFEYSMWGGISKLLEQKSYGIAWLLILFSGIWPVLKLVSLLVVVLFPEHPLMSSSQRYVILGHFCQLGRLSFMDIWVVILIVNCIQINVDSLPGFGVSIWVQAVAERGSTLFLTAILLSQAISNTLITVKHLQEFNRRSNGAYYQQGQTEDPEFHPSSSSAGGGEATGAVNVWDTSAEEELVDSEKLRFSDQFSLFHGFQVQALIVVWALLVVVAVFVPCYSITYTADNETIAQPTYSFLTGLTSVANNSHPETYSTNSPNPTVLAFFGVLLVILLPILQVVGILFIWFAPLRFSTHTTIHLWLDNFSHLSSLDTFALALVVVSAEMGNLLNKSDLGKFIQVSMAPTGAFAFVAVVALGLSPLMRYVLLHHRLFLLGRASLRPVSSGLSAGLLLS